MGLGAGADPVAAGHWIWVDSSIPTSCCLYGACGSNNGVTQLFHRRSDSSTFVALGKKLLTFSSHQLFLVQCVNVTIEQGFIYCKYGVFLDKHLFQMDLWSKISLILYFFAENYYSLQKAMCCILCAANMQQYTANSFFIDEQTFWINSANKNTLIPKFLVY